MPHPRIEYREIHSKNIKDNASQLIKKFSTHDKVGINFTRYVIIADAPEI